MSVAAAKLDSEHKIRGGKVSRRRATIRTKKTSSPWRPLISATITFLNNQPYSRLALRLVRTAASVGGASCENWLISDTSCRIPFFSTFVLLERRSDTFFAADQHQKRISEPALRRTLVFGYWLSRYALTFSKYSVGGVSTAICCWAGRRSSLGDRKRRVHSHNLRVKNYFVIVKCD